MDGVMPIKNRFADLQNEMVTWRHDFHEYPELQFDLPRTTTKIIELLNEFGVNSIKTKIGKSGIVAEIYGQKRDSGRAIGFRADMDALPVSEMNNFSYKSKIENKMHACGHDGHTTILLGVAKYLCETRNFDGTVVLAFQPAEEGGGGAKAMVDDGLISDWNIEEIYGLHNLPNLQVGEFAIKSGPLMAASDFFEIIVEGKGGHAALPHFSNDTTLASSAIVLALQQIVSRRISALQAVVLSVTGLSTDTMAHNVTPDSVRITGTTRFLNEVERQKKTDSNDSHDFHEYIRDTFSNRLIIVDEVHNIREGTGKDFKKIPIILGQIYKHATNVRLLFLSATPMYNEASEITLLMNIMMPEMNGIETCEKIRLITVVLINVVLPAALGPVIK